LAIRAVVSGRHAVETAAMATTILAGPGGDAHAAQLAVRLGAPIAAAVTRRFPDGESYVRIDHELTGHVVLIVASLDQPHDKFLPLAFLAGTARELGAARVGLVSPYLAFMRQDHRFQPGEGITSVHFARLLSGVVDFLVTVDPHLHRWRSLDQLYAIPTTIAAAAPAIARWIAAEVAAPVLIGPDAESVQWVAAVAAAGDLPFAILEKTRRGDRDVSVSAPADAWPGRTPVIVDDIISTGRTMIEATRQLRAAGAAAPVCVGIHAVFADEVVAALTSAGAARVVTCDTIGHATNAISIADELAAATRAALR
jgi:ribose-phosphate pyrophosphokinase